MAHYPHNAFHDIVNIGKIPFAVPVIEYFDSFAGAELIREPEIRHIRTARRPIHRKESKTGGRDIVQLAVCVRHKLIAFLGGSIQADRIVHLVIGAVRHFFIASVHGRG